MHNITISPMQSVDELSSLHGYNKATMDLLEKNFKLKDSLYLVANKGEEVIGFCSVDRDWWEENLFFIREIFVDSNFQKLGIGKMLMSRCIEHARSKEAIGVVTETAFLNLPMRRLCEKLGFNEWDNPKWKEGVTYRLVFQSIPSPKAICGDKTELFKGA